jgi:putative alpha-1,2-mannosidase
MSRASVRLSWAGLFALFTENTIKLVPTYLYNYVGQPVKTVDRVDATVAMYYNTS